MKNHLAKTLIISTLLTGIFCFQSGLSIVTAQRSSNIEQKQATESELNEGIEDTQKIIKELTLKIYSASLFSPEDNDKLIGLKLKLYDLWSKNPTNRELAKPMYETAGILNKREMKEEAIELLNIVIENFPADEEMDEETISIDYSAKAQAMLDKINQQNAGQ
jgi:hypothetical protein